MFIFVFVSVSITGKRYYGGNINIDKVEKLCQTRALAAMNVDEKEWGVNVQPYSGSTANIAVYTGLLDPHDRIMGLDLPSGGHLTHGFYTPKRKVSATSIYFESFPYRVDGKTGLVDYEKLRENAKIFNPKMIICGGSAYPREWEYATLRSIADEVGAYLLCDMAHISGLVAAQVVDSPFDYCDVVTTTTHKTLRGPRAGMIFFKRDERGFENKINTAVFPSLQGGPHNHQIAAIATQLKQVASPEFKVYAQQVINNTQAMAANLVGNGYTLSTGGTDNHLLLMNLRPQGITGSKMETVCDMIGITLNKNAVHGDRSALSPGGVRIGAAALTSRGFSEADFKQVGEFLHRAVQIVVAINNSGPEGVKMTEKKFKVALQSLDATITESLKALENDVKAFASSFPMPATDLTPENYAARKAEIEAL